MCHSLTISLEVSILWSISIFVLAALDLFILSLRFCWKQRDLNSNHWTRWLPRLPLSYRRYYLAIDLIYERYRRCRFFHYSININFKYINVYIIHPSVASHNTLSLRFMILFLTISFVHLVFKFTWNFSCFVDN